MDIDNELKTIKQAIGRNAGACSCFTGQYC